MVNPPAIIFTNVVNIPTVSTAFVVIYNSMAAAILFFLHSTKDNIL